MAEARLDSLYASGARTDHSGHSRDAPGAGDPARQRFRGWTRGLWLPRPRDTRERVRQARHHDPDGRDGDACPGVRSCARRRDHEARAAHPQSPSRPCAPRPRGRGHGHRRNDPPSAAAGAPHGFTGESDGVSVRVEIAPAGRRERWSRKFGKRRFHSTLKAAGKAGGRRVTEKFGPFAFDIRLAPDESRLGFVVTRARVFGIPYPRILAPKVTAFETAEDDRFMFDVKIEHFLFDLIVHYRGWLVPVQHAGPSLATARDKARPTKLADPTWPF
ncbi:MAG: DUF4166 domain-containing protein [Alphaproteobacteria bacterium]